MLVKKNKVYVRYVDQLAYIIPQSHGLYAHSCVGGPGVSSRNIMTYMFS